MDVISRQAAIDAFEKRTHIDWESLKILHPMFEVLEDLPSAERRGRWIWMGDYGDSRFMCSVCKSKEKVPTIMGKPTVWSHCPNCGARMEAKGNGND